jgi:hypothetical protein
LISYVSLGDWRLRNGRRRHCATGGAVVSAAVVALLAAKRKLDPADAIQH